MCFRLDPLITLSQEISYYVTSVTASGSTDSGASVSFNIIEDQCKSDIVRADLSDTIFDVTKNPPRISFMAFSFSSQFLPLDVSINVKCKYILNLLIILNNNILNNKFSVCVTSGGSPDPSCYSVPDCAAKPRYSP